MENSHCVRNIGVIMLKEYLEIIKLMPEVESARKYKNHLVIKTHMLHIDKIQNMCEKLATPLPLGKMTIKLCVKRCKEHEPGWSFRSTVHKRIYNCGAHHHPHFFIFSGKMVGCCRDSFEGDNPVSKLVTILGLLRKVENFREIDEFYGKDVLYRTFVDNFMSQGWPDIITEQWFTDPVDDTYGSTLFYPDMCSRYNIQYSEQNHMILEDQYEGCYFILWRK